MKNMFFDISLELEEKLRVFRPADTRHSRVSQGTVIYDLTYQKGLRLRNWLGLLVSAVIRLLSTT